MTYHAPGLSHEFEGDDATAPARPALRVLYATGPGDVLGTYAHWRDGRDDPSSVALTYSGQFYSAARALGAEAYVIAPRPDGRVFHDRAFTIEDRRIHCQGAGGLRYHLGQLWYGLRLWATAMRFGADAAVVSAGTHWFALAPLALSGVKVIPTLHCALWPAGYRPAGKLRRAIQWLDGLFWRKFAHATICVSPECERQVRAIARDRPLRGRVYQVRAQYRRDALDTIPPAVHGKPLRVLYAGRIERNKGVFDLLDVIERLQRARPGWFTVELCGSGGAEAELREEIDRRGLGAVARATGQLESAQMRGAFARAHVIVVPTTRDFAEGLNKVAVEAALAGRPVVTSRLANVSDVLGDAVIEVPPGDLGAYQAALERLADDPAAYAAAQAACAHVQQMFYDRSFGWETAVRRILGPLRHDRAAKRTMPNNPLRGAGDRVPLDVPEPEPADRPAASDNRERRRPAVRDVAPPASHVR
jgi:glycosyltransferase involved in cell wall biosynthesis